MLSIAKISGGREHYYANEIATTKEDYYTAQKLSFEPAGLWIGEGARRVKIEGEKVIKDELRELLKGYTPDGQTALVQNAGKFEGTQRDRMPGFDLTFSAPKSVSVCWAIGGEETRAGIERAQFQAVKKCVEGFESHIVIRLGKGGTQREKAGLIVGVVQHVTSRQIDKKTMPDMQLHSHTMVINTGIAGNGKSGAVKGYDFYQMQKEYDALYKAELAKGLRELGFSLKTTKHGFEIDGVPSEVIQHFSKRSRQIEEKTPRDNSDAMERMIANLSTREVKGDVDEQALQRNWNKEAMKLGFTRGTVEQLRAKDSQHNEPIQALTPVEETACAITNEKAFQRSLSREELKQKLDELEKQEAKEKAEAALEKRVESPEEKTNQIEEKTPRDNSSSACEQTLQRSWNEETIKSNAIRENVKPVGIEKSRYNEQEEARASVREAVIVITNEKPIFTKAELIKETIKAGVGRGVGKQKAEEEVKAFLEEKGVRIEGGRIAEPNYTTEKKLEQAEKTRAERRAEERKIKDGLSVIKREGQKEGYKVFAVERETKRAEEQTKRGLQAYTSRRILADFKREEEEKKAGGRDNVRAKRTTWEKITLKQNSSRNERRIIATAKQLIGQMDAKTAKRYSGDYWKPTTKAYHAFLYATGQCTKGEHDALNRELERQQRTVDGKTVVFISKDAKLSQAERVALIEGVRERGGQVIIGDPKDFKPGEVKEMLRSGSGLHLKTAAQKAAPAQKPFIKDRRKEQEQDHEKERSR